MDQQMTEQDQLALGEAFAEHALASAETAEHVAVLSTLPEGSPEYMAHMPAYLAALQREQEAARALTKIANRLSTEETHASQ